MADLEDPLLQKKVYPNCPACKNAYLRSKDAGIPYKEFTFLALLILCNALPISSLYPFLYFMVQDFHIAKSDSDIGFYAGAIGAAFMIGRCLTSVPWGIAADKYGRKPVMIAGVASVIVFHTLFGASVNFWMALSTRFLLGGFNGMLGPAKAYATEICSEKHQALGASIVGNSMCVSYAEAHLNPSAIFYVGTTWGLGLIIGPVLGGYLSQPAIKYPTLFPEGSLFARFPYLLPSLCNGVFAVGVLITSFQLPETLHKHDSDELKEEIDKIESNGQPPSTAQLPRSKSLGEPRRQLTVSVCEGIDCPTLRSPIGSCNDRSDRLQRTLSRRGSKSVESTGDSSGQTTWSSDHTQSGQVDAPQDIRPKHMLEHSSESQTKETIVAPPEDEHRLREKKKSLLTNWPVMAAIAVYCIWSLHDMAYTEIFSLWCVSPASVGGLSFTTTDVGQVLAISGFGMLLFQLLVFAPVTNYFGPIFVTRIAAGLSVPLIAAYSFIPSLHGAMLWVILCLASILKCIFSVMTLTGSFLLLNNAVTQDQKGAANGLSMSLVSFFKALGPAGGGSLFAWAQSRQDTNILPGNEIVFFFLGLTALITFILTYEPFLPASTDHPVPESDD